MTSRWAVAGRALRCGYCAERIAEGQPVLFLELSPRRNLARCVTCARATFEQEVPETLEAPLEFPALREPLGFTPARQLAPVLFADFKQRASGE